MKYPIHVVILDPRYAEAHMPWLKRFVLVHSSNPPVHFFACASYSNLQAGELMVEFEVVPKKANVEQERVLLPLHAVAAILPEHSHKNPLGFAQGEFHE